MNKPLVERIPFAKIAVILAVTAAVSVGLCGVGVALLQFSNRPGLEGKLSILSLAIGAIAFWLSVLGLVAVFAVWIILAIIQGNQRSGP
jgi:hypothetical protein